MQRYCLIMCRSLTYAQRSSQVLERAGITATVLKAPQSVSKTGCTYCVKLMNPVWFVRWRSWTAQRSGGVRCIACWKMALTRR